MRLGASLVLRGGMALVAVVLGGVLVIGELAPAVIGFALCGLGIANAVPLLFSAAGRHDPPGPSLAATFTVGYTGFIVGPPVIGFVADRIGLPWTLSLLVAAALAVTALGGRATRSAPPTRRSLALPLRRVERALERLVELVDHAARTRRAGGGGAPRPRRRHSASAGSAARHRSPAGRELEQVRARVLRVRDAAREAAVDQALDVVAQRRQRDAGRGGDARRRHGRWSRMCVTSASR